MPALDLKKDLKHLYAPSGKAPSQADVPEMNFLMIDGQGDPRGQAYMETVGVLYGVAYAIRSHLKKTQGFEFVVMPLEGLWWVDNLDELNFEDRSNWKWTMMIMQPEQVTAEIVAQCCTEIQTKHGLESAPPVRLESFAEGPCAQILFVGPYKDEMPAIDRLHDYIEDQGARLTGKHHEIYLSDPKRTAPEKLKTILRQPLRMK